MNIHEYQAKAFFRSFGIPTPKGQSAFSLDEAKLAAAELIAETGDETVVVKAQIHAGGRGKGGGVKVVKGAKQAREAAQQLLGSQLVTHQTGPTGKKVERLLIEQGVSIAKEFYLAAVVDRTPRRIVVMASTEGGVNIEEVAAKTPEKLFKEVVDPALGFMPYQARKLGYALGLSGTAHKEFTDLAQSLLRLFVACDCSIAEINPLVLTTAGHILALDAKINFDENAEFRHHEWQDLRDLSEENPTEIKAKQAGLNYIQLDGNIGCLVNGAGLAMATMDIVKHFGGEPANFLDVGGGASQEAVTQAFRILLSSNDVKGVFVNIFGGIMRCDIIAEGVVTASKDVGLRVPAVVRLEGTNVEKGREILRNSGLALTPVKSMIEGAKAIVQLVAEARSRGV